MPATTPEDTDETLPVHVSADISPGTWNVRMRCSRSGADVSVFGHASIQAVAYAR